MNPIIFVAAASGGIFRSQDAGVTWKPVFDEAGTALSIGDIAIDGDAIKQVCWNLILNALEATPPGGRLAVRSSAHQGCVEVEVADSGPGIDKKALRRVFEPFFTTKDKGTGLGLPIADKIVRAHGGTMDIQSDAGSGTRVRVLLPRECPAGRNGGCADTGLGRRRSG